MHVVVEQQCRSRPLCMFAHISHYLTNVFPLPDSCDAVQVKVKAAGAEPELISWEEVEAQKDVYQAITTPDGRQALVKAAPGALPLKHWNFLAH